MHILEMDSNSNEPVTQEVKQFHDELNPRQQKLVIPHDLSLISKAYYQRNDNQRILWTPMVRKFAARPKTRDALKEINDFAIVAQGFLTQLTQTNHSSLNMLPRFDLAVEHTLEYMKGDGYKNTIRTLTVKNLLNYSLLLIDLGILTRNDMFAHAPHKSVIHGLALTSMFFVLAYEAYAQYWPDLDRLDNIAMEVDERSLASKQYKMVIEDLRHELAGEVTPRFFHHERELIARWKFAKNAENAIAFVPRFFFGAFILAPVSIPMAIAAPMCSFDQRVRVNASIANPLIFGLAIYFYAFVFMLVSEDVSDFLDKIVYCEDDACFSHEVLLSTAALGGGFAATMAILLYALGRFLNEYVQEHDCSAQSVMQGMRNCYQGIRGRAPDQQPLLGQEQDIELGEITDNNYSPVI